MPLDAPAAAVPPFRAPFAPDDGALIAGLIAAPGGVPEGDPQLGADAARLIAAVRGEQSGLGVEAFLREFALSTREGLALMVLAEALLRVPDAATTDRLIEDKLTAARFDEHESVVNMALIDAATWGLGLTARVVSTADTPSGILAGLVKRVGVPTVRQAARRAMRMMGHQFVLGETIEAALARAKPLEKRGYLHSYDMLGEGARSRADAEHHFAAYAAALPVIGRSAGTAALPLRPGLSVKLSALHPRYEATNQPAVMAELAPRLIDLARAAKAFDLNLTVDAEEADRLELSLDVFAAVAADPSLAGWDGFGLAIQAYQKRGPAVADWVIGLAEALGRRFMIRLVKGAYWDSEVKRAQERGLADYPVFTQKAASDLAYSVIARKLIAARPRIHPQFASHNARTVAEIRRLVALSGRSGGYEFQRLHGMGEALFREVTDKDGIPCRIYAPVGGHRDLLAYLVRRLIENGANSSFVAQVGDHTVPVERLMVSPAAALRATGTPRHPAIPLPAALFGAERANSRGLEWGVAAERHALMTAIATETAPVAATALVDGRPLAGRDRPVVSPVDGRRVVGTVCEPAAAPAADAAMSAAAAGFAAWSATAPALRAAALRRAADLLEARRARFLHLLAREGGKTLGDGLAEIREAADFCRYYAAEEERHAGRPTRLPGPTGEDNRLIARGRGVFVAISPWNFPLAIFTGQIAAALVTGNAVVAKPAEQTPLVAFEMVGLLHEAGIPTSVLHLLPGDGATGAALVADARVAGVVFTGSTEVARAINRALAAKDGPIVPLIAETGGLNAMIVDATALPEQVTDDVIASAFRSAGQRCSALRLLFLQEDVAAPMLRMIEGAAAELRLGDPADPATDVGPLIDAEAKAAVATHVAAATDARAATPVPAAFPDGHFVAPTVIRLADAASLTREVFGPVLHVATYPADGLDRVLEIIAASGYGLTLGLHTRIDALVDTVVSRLPVGNVYVNRNMIGAVVGSQPFGGSGLSGTGPKAGGPAYLDRFRLEQTVTINTAAAGGNATLVATA
jgi:RHH-type proline utilization regulon transcriptional repressor/proline dehydrogenase/delta 1-pyrroline-5-carboxylate dehydrogenase